MPLDDVEVALENKTSSPRRQDTNFVARLEPGLPESLDRNRRLVLRADPGEASTSFLYFLHEK